MIYVEKESRHLSIVFFDKKLQYTPAKFLTFDKGIIYVVMVTAIITNP